MASNKSVGVKIFAKDYQVACPEEQAHHLLDAALLLDNRMKEIRASGRVIGVERIAVMAALNLAHELLTYQAEIKSSQQQTDQKLIHLHDKLNAALQAKYEHQ